MNKAASILVVDDDQRLCDLLRRYLTREGFRVSTVLSGEQMRRHIELDLPNLVLLDLMLGDADGLQLAQELRKHPGLGIIIITGKDDTVDKIIGLEVGADDYIAKPFQNRELLARVRSVLRRLHAPGDAPATPETGPETVHFSGWTLDFAAHDLYAPDGEKVFLTAKEFRLLSLLVKHGNRVLSRDRLMEQLSEREWSPIDRSLDVLIGKLRRKIRDVAEADDFIKTVRGEGYLFTARIENRRNVEPDE
ncbi:MAG: response regulator [Gammaproteobacteria bacterium]|nr:MAG: response regulator [Gammaproteobacteria bacterium]